MQPQELFQALSHLEVYDGSTTSEEDGEVEGCLASEARALVDVDVDAAVEAERAVESLCQERRAPSPVPKAPFKVRTARGPPPPEPKLTPRTSSVGSRARVSSRASSNTSKRLSMPALRMTAAASAAVAMLKSSSSSAELPYAGGKARAKKLAQPPVSRSAATGPRSRSVGWRVECAPDGSGAADEAGGRVTQLQNEVARLEQEFSNLWEDTVRRPDVESQATATPPILWPRPSATSLDRPAEQEHESDHLLGWGTSAECSELPMPRQAWKNLVLSGLLAHELSSEEFLMSQRLELLNRSESPEKSRSSMGTDWAPSVQGLAMERHVVECECVEDFPDEIEADGDGARDDAKETPSASVSTVAADLATLAAGSWAPVLTPDGLMPVFCAGDAGGKAPALLAAAEKVHAASGAATAAVHEALMDHLQLDAVDAANLAMCASELTAAAERLRNLVHVTKPKRSAAAAQALTAPCSTPRTPAHPQREDLSVTLSPIESQLSVDHGRTRSRERCSVTPPSCTSPPGSVADTVARERSPQTVSRRSEPVLLKHVSANGAWIAGSGDGRPCSNGARVMREVESGQSSGRSWSRGAALAPTVTTTFVVSGSCATPRQGQASTLAPASRAPSPPRAGSPRPIVAPPTDEPRSRPQSPGRLTTCTLGIFSPGRPQPRRLETRGSAASPGSPSRPSNRSASPVSRVLVAGPEQTRSAGTRVARVHEETKPKTTPVTGCSVDTAAGHLKAFGDTISSHAGARKTVSGCSIDAGSSCAAPAKARRAQSNQQIHPQHNHQWQGQQQPQWSGPQEQATNVTNQGLACSPASGRLSFGGPGFTPGEVPTRCPTREPSPRRSEVAGVATEPARGTKSDANISHRSAPGVDSASSVPHPQCCLSPRGHAPTPPQSQGLACSSASGRLSFGGPGASPGEVPTRCSPGVDSSSAVPHPQRCLSPRGQAPTPSLSQEMSTAVPQSPWAAARVQCQHTPGVQHRAGSPPATPRQQSFALTRASRLSQLPATQMHAGAGSLLSASTSTVPIPPPPVLA